MDHTTIAVDLAKSVFEIAVSGHEGHVTERHRVTRAQFVNFFAQHLELAALEKQALLEAQSLGARAARLCDVLEFQLESLRVPLPRAPGRTH